MNNLMAKIKYSLDNEEGNVHVETLIGTVLALAVGVCVYKIYKEIRNSFNQKIQAKASIDIPMKQ